MSKRERFGNYLLLKKISEDPIGESFRAGKIGPGGMEQVVLLRVVNGPGVDAAAFKQAIEGRSVIQKALHSPNISEGVDVGQVRGTPFAAWEYLSSQTIADLRTQAARRNSPIPPDHALLISERIALALAVGYETRVGGERCLHGALVPELVRLSNEGETRVSGFEIAPGLRKLFASQPDGLGRYLCPEALQGEPVHKADDVFSLGVITTELLTGRTLERPANFDYGPVIAAATQGIDGEPLSDEIQQHLQRSLTTRDQRIGDVVSWHKTLSKLMFEGQYNPTTFNIAFYMHNLFREDIERETQEIEVEKSVEVPAFVPDAPAPTEAAAPKPASSGDLSEETGVREDTLAVRERYGMEGGEKTSKTPLIAAGVGLLAILAVLGVVFLGGGNQPEPAPMAATPVPAPPPPPPAEPQGPSPEELQTQIQEMIQRQAEDYEEGLRQQYDDRLQELQKQLQQAQQEAARREREAAEAAAARVAEEETAQTADEEAPPAEEPVAVASTPEAVPPSPAPPEPEPTEVAQAQPAPAPAPAPTPPPPPPKPEPRVQLGELVEPGPGVVRPDLVRQAAASFPSAARRMNRRQATVIVRVLVDENGDVIDTEIKQEAGFGFDREAEQAARASQYKPATKDGVRVKMWVDQVVRFKM